MKQAEAEVAPSSSLIEIEGEGEVGVEVEGSRSSVESGNYFFGRGGGVAGCWLAG